MAIVLLDNSKSLFSSYVKGWEHALKVFEEEETSSRHYKRRGNQGKKKN